MLTFTVEELIRFLSNWTMTFFEGAKRSGDIVFSRYYSFFKHPVLVREHQVEYSSRRILVTSVVS